MKKIFTTLLFILSFSFCKAQWEQLSGPTGNFDVTGIASKDSLLIISPSCGIYYSFNDGVEWTPMNYNRFKKSAIFKDTLYIADYSHYYNLSDPTPDVNPLIKVFNNGHTVYEKEVPFDFTYCLDLYSDSTIICAADNKKGFIYSYDGENWNTDNNGLISDTYVFNIPFFPYSYTFVFTTVFSVCRNSNYFFAGTHHGIYRKSAISQTWLNIDKYNSEFFSHFFKENKEGVCTFI